MSRFNSFPRLAREAQILVIENSMKKVPSIVAGTVFNALLAGFVFWSNDWRRLFVVSWLALSLLVSVARLRHWYRRRAQPRTAMNPVKEERTLSLFALTGGLLWGGMMIASGFGSDPVQFALLAMLGGGVLTIAIVSYGQLVRAAVAFIVPLASGGIASWIIWVEREGAFESGHGALPAIIMIAMFTLLLLKTVRDNERMFIAKVQGEMALRESAETVQMLLTDFESQSADWLWRVDAEGMIQSPSVRFSAVSRRACTQLEEMRFVELFEASPEKDMLRVHLGLGSPFHGLIVPLQIDGNRHWWALSARSLEGGGMRGVASDATAEKLLEARSAKAAA